MKSEQLLLRCLVERRKGVWQGFCIDLNLAAQGESAEEVHAKLEEQISDYLYDALVGQDKEYAQQLLGRPAPISIRARYHYFAAISSIQLFGEKWHVARNMLARLLRDRSPFTEPMPLIPGNRDKTV